jgi:hypothetical protein
VGGGTFFESKLLETNERRFVGVILAKIRKFFEIESNDGETSHVSFADVLRSPDLQRRLSDKDKRYFERIRNRFQSDGSMIKPGKK